MSNHVENAMAEAPKLYTWRCHICGLRMNKIKPTDLIAGGSWWYDLHDKEWQKAHQGCLSRVTPGVSDWQLPKLDPEEKKEPK